MRHAPATTSAAPPLPHAAAPDVVRGRRLGPLGDPLDGPGALGSGPSRAALARGVLLALAATGTLLLLVFAPPFLPAEPRAGLESAFSMLCHRLPARSFHLHGVALGMCQRDTGLVAGLVLGALAYPFVHRLDMRIGPKAPLVLAAAALPLALDWALTFFGLWENTPLSRTATGALAGLVAGVFLTRGFVEMAAPRTAATSPAPTDCRAASTDLPASSL